MHLTALILLSVCLVLKTLLSRKWFISVLYDWKPVSQFMETVVIQLDMSWNFSYRLKAVVIFIKQRISYSNNFGACTWIETWVFSRPLNATDSLSFVDHAVMHIKPDEKFTRACKLGVCMTFLFKIACHLIICRNKRIWHKFQVCFL